MSYQVLARKYRPQNFDEVVGQEPIVQTLKNAIEKNRIHHAYLFTGVRGTGKTSLARILAKSLNCESGPTVQPCDTCSNCQAINRGQFLDVMEIDGASNTSVDSVRELREQVKYVPAAGQYKVYIIDEVHMLSTSAFNALLKTLEEPPDHVIFVFATTEVHKIPVTILSRCQRFDLRRLSSAQLLQRLQWICQQEGVSQDTASLELLARWAEGSMRDAQSLLDMAIGVCGETLQTQALREMLGLVESTWIEDLSADCLQGNIQAALAKVEEIYQRGYDLRQVALQWVEYWHDLIVLKAAGPEALGTEFSEDQVQHMATLVAEVSVDDLQVAFQSVYRASEQIFRSETPKILFDLLLVKLVHGTPYQSLGSVLATGELSAPAKPKVALHSKTASVAKASPPPVAPEPVPVPEKTPVSPQRSGGDFQALLKQALQGQPQTKALLDHASSCVLEEDRLVVGFETGSMWLEMFQEKQKRLAEGLQKALGRPITVSVREEAKVVTAPPTSQAPQQEVSADPVVQQAVDIFKATVKEVRKVD